MVALASDAKAVVLAAPDGSLQRYRSGERLADTPWRLVDVRANEAVFARALPGRGGALNVGVQAGATVDFAALDRRHGTPPVPQPDLDFRLIPLPKR
ncbi:hypothetical protein [Tahibacter caeni]|uniref:hypothetical protein n=1 Tax=Tahibacter caeni TaxID=1453545 RepID=UPI0021490840|nr:hypothetical protein [Tahibacter caeni]